MSVCNLFAIVINAASRAGPWSSDNVLTTCSTNFSSVGASSGVVEAVVETSGVVVEAEKFIEHVVETSGVAVEAVGSSTVSGAVRVVGASGVVGRSGADGVVGRSGTNVGASAAVGAVDEQIREYIITLNRRVHRY